MDVRTNECRGCDNNGVRLVEYIIKFDLPQLPWSWNWDSQNYYY